MRAVLRPKECKFTEIQEEQAMRNNKVKMKSAKTPTQYLCSEAVRERMRRASLSEREELFAALGTTANGHTAESAENAQEKYGENRLTQGKKNTLFKRLCAAFINPFTIVLLVLAVISLFTDILLIAPEERNYVTVVIITAMVLISGILRFIQETRSGNVAEKLTAMIHTTACVMRDGVRQEIAIEEIAVGDILYFSAGDMIPADLRILEAKDLFISQSALTGESEPVEKLPADPQAGSSLTEIKNLVFMGSNVISGTAQAVAVAVGDDTLLGNMARDLNQKPVKTTFEKGVNSVSWILIRFMLCMVPVVLLVNGFTKGDWMQAALFAISIAVGLTPEMLPMIVTTALAKGAMAMSKKRVVIKNLNSIQNLGSVDILCTGLAHPKPTAMIMAAPIQSI